MRPPGHIERMFNDGDEMFHDLIRTQLILPYVKGDFDEKHMMEAAGGKFFALKQLPTCCHWLGLAEGTGTLSVAEVNSDAANFWMST